MILGLGCDIVEISRFDKGDNFLRHFMRKYFTAKEIEEIRQKRSNQNYEELKITVATRFAAKEAVAKALGTGFRNGITLKDIEVQHDSVGKPEIILYNQALSRAYEIANRQEFRVYLTLSNERAYSNAVAVIEKLYDTKKSA